MLPRIYFMENFSEWLRLREMVGTGAVYDPKMAKNKEDWNWWGTPGTTGATPKKGVKITKSEKQKKS